MTETIETALVDQLLRRDFNAFLRMTFETVSGGEQLKANWHHQAIGWNLEQARRGDITRLMICMPPRNLKSITVSVAWVAWMLGHDPGLNFVCVSYSNDLARKHASDCRAVLESGWYRHAFPRTKTRRGAASEVDFRTTKGGGRLSTSVGGTLTGRGGDILIIDDPMKPEEAMSDVRREAVKTWYANILQVSPRAHLRRAGPRCVSPQQRRARTARTQPDKWLGVCGRHRRPCGTWTGLLPASDVKARPPRGRCPHGFHCRGRDGP